MATQTHDDIISMVERWIRHELPLINRGTEAHGDVRFVIGRCQIHVEAIAHAARDTRDPETAMRLLQLLAFAVSSVERHMQIAGNAPGDGVSALQAGRLLMNLADLAEHPPRDSHETYWLQNRGDMPLTFTGLSQESVLIRIMNEMQHLYAISVAGLRPVCAGELSISSRSAIEAMEFAAGSIERITLLLHSFLAPAMENRPRSAMQFEVFSMTLGMYLCDYPVGAQTWLAPDPANISGPMELDLAIGLSEERRREMIRRRMVQMNAGDRGRVMAAMQQSSLAARMAEAAGLTEEELGRMPDREVAAHMSLRPCLLGALKSYAHLANSADTSASYLEVVHDHLGRAPSAISMAMSNMRTLVQRVDQFDTMPQPPDVRTSDPTVRRLLAAACA